MEVEASGGFHIGKDRAVVQEQGQASALPEVRRGGAGTDEASGLGEELFGEVRTMTWRGPRHETAPWATGQLIVSDDTCILRSTQGSVTLQLFVKRTT